MTTRVDMRSLIMEQDNEYQRSRRHDETPDELKERLKATRPDGPYVTDDPTSDQNRTGFATSATDIFQNQRSRRHDETPEEARQHPTVESGPTLFGYPVSHELYRSWTGRNWGTE